MFTFKCSLDYDQRFEEWHKSSYITEEGTVRVFHGMIYGLFKCFQEFKNCVTTSTYARLTTVNNARRESVRIFNYLDSFVRDSFE